MTQEKSLTVVEKSIHVGPCISPVGVGNVRRRNAGVNVADVVPVRLAVNSNSLLASGVAVVSARVIRKTFHLADTLLSPALN